MEKKKKFYSLSKLTKRKCDVYIIVGGRNNGKSYSVKNKCMKDFRDGKGKFAYVRRFDSERTVNKVEKYFNDLKLNDGEKLKAYANDLTLYYDKDNSEICGHYFSVQNEPQYKSENYGKIKNIFFEEIITDSSYLYEEFRHFNNLLSTITRNNKDVTLWLVGNTIDRLCPYFEHYKIDIRKIKQGNIYYFEITNDNGTITKVGLEYCSSDGVFTSSIITGSTVNMISKGEWDIDETLNTCNNWQGFINYDVENPVFTFYIQKAKVCYKGMILELNQECFDYGDYVMLPKAILYFYPYSFEKLHMKKDINKIRILDLNSTLPTNFYLHNSILHNSIACDIIISELFKKNCVVCSDSLTAMEINNIRKEKGWI